MNYTAKDYFPDWYKAAKLEVTKEIIKWRLDAINEVIKIEKKGFWLDVVRIAVGLPPVIANTQKEFTSIFRKTDNSFPISNNENLLKVLAGITLCFKLEAEDIDEEVDESGEEEEEAEETAAGKKEEAEAEEIDYETRTNINTALSLAILNLNLFGQHKEDGNVPFPSFAQNYLQARTYLERMDEEGEDHQERLEKLEQELVDDADMDTEDHKTVVEVLQTVIKRNEVLSEELNTLSWIFGEYSKLGGKFFAEVGVPLMVTLGPLELQEKSAKMHYLPSAKGLLQKILTISNSSKKLTNVNAFDAVNSLPNEIKVELTKNFKAHISELTPYFFAVLKSLEFENGVDYSSSYKKISNGADIKKSLKPDLLASQIYNEVVFIKTLENV